MGCLTSPVNGGGLRSVLSHLLDFILTFFYIFPFFLLRKQKLVGFSVCVFGVYEFVCSLVDEEC